MHEGLWEGFRTLSLRTAKNTDNSIGEQITRHGISAHPIRNTRFMCSKSNPMILIAQLNSWLRSDFWIKLPSVTSIAPLWVLQSTYKMSKNVATPSTPIVWPKYLPHWSGLYYFPDTPRVVSQSNCHREIGTVKSPWKVTQVHMAIWNTIEPWKSTVSNQMIPMHFTMTKSKLCLEGEAAGPA